MGRQMQHSPTLDFKSGPVIGLVLWLALLSSIWLVVPVSGEEVVSGVEFFENRIRPQLVENCYECHSARAKKVKGGLRLDTREDLLKGGDSGVVVIPGDPDKSLLVQAVRHLDKKTAMPRTQDGVRKLPEGVIADLIRWIQIGAPYPTAEFDQARSSVSSHWSFQPVRSPPEPTVRNNTWPENSIDRFILAKIERAGLQPAAPADRRMLIRRATFDLTGLPPRPEEVDDFLSDTSTNAFARVVERLLNSPHYGEQWGRHWLDVARYADTAGDTADYPVPVAWRYRNYVIDAFNADKPYDEFIREQIAGDILAKQGSRERYAERVTATGYLAVSRRFGFDSENYHHLTIQDTIDTMGQSVLGLSLGCARCHNHKFDPISSSEYYGLYGIFESTRYSFPGSEQKSKVRGLVPLVPVEESQPKWRAFEARFAAYGVNPGAVLRSLDDLDGDFELQHIASGGSKGVLVPPWFYEGPLSVTQEAQSPFKNLHPYGGVGINVAGGTNEYQVRQALHPARTHGLLYINIDFRVATNATVATGRHRFWIGAQEDSPAAELFISSASLLLPGPDRCEIPLPKPGQWNNLQLTLDLNNRVFSGTVGVPGQVVVFTNRPFAKTWPGIIDFMAIDSGRRSQDHLPGVDLDNMGVQEETIPPVATVLPSTVAEQTSKLTELTAQLQILTGIDGDFEFQTDGMSPVKPWHPGPNSVVRISTNSQSPFCNLYPSGRLGIHLPETDGYNGFGQTLTNLWKTNVTERLYLGFDVRSMAGKIARTGTWRFHAGHGSASTAVELGFSENSFYRRSLDVRDLICSLHSGEWYQVQLILNLKTRSYDGTIATRSERTEFSGQFASGWDGSIDYIFIDSGGHLPGTKPALDADNFICGERPLPSLEAPPVTHLQNLKQIGEVRNQITVLKADADKRRRELDALLAEGPVDLAYGVSEGTPHNARIQLRGDPDKPGPEVPRGFLKALGGSILPSNATGSGRLELADWLTRPENPLTARVMVNRIWQYHFGQGLVKTPNDFGVRGQPPTDPELLDHLATIFIKNKWSIKAMHRTIMLSATYQQDSKHDAEAGRVDHPHGDLYWQFTRRRLGAEELRDSILFVSGDLDTSPGRGHPFPPATSWGYTQHGPFSAVYDHRQRSVYLMTQRLKRHPFLALFDGADPNASTPDRRVTTVPTQALYFLNDPFVHAQSEKFASLLTRSGSENASRIAAAYRLAFGRSPSDSEKADAINFLETYRAEFSAKQKEEADSIALAAFARVLFGNNEFVYID
ncbi:MAG: Protein of unknown function (DUF1553)/Protein of unknown function (DUF1549)/Planctomycete [Verrucomicrobiales bacterium]|nr:Protein of unknown function (DUF1553)/Protein of unknown function (DUF1549)/Planctomycete [Verrucomicrobiales bacterium]